MPRRTTSSADPVSGSRHRSGPEAVGADAGGGHGGEPSILHVDIDCFFAAVEAIDDRSLAGRAVIVGGTGDRSVVASASYEARAYGVRSAMPVVQARRLCPHAEVRPGRYSRYEEVSRSFHDILLSVTPLVECISLDEAFLDVSGARRTFGDAETIACRLRTDISESMGISVSVGIGCTKFVAKLASRAAKPRIVVDGSSWPGRVEPGAGVAVVAPGTETAFLHPLGVSAIWGVGPATRARLSRLGVETVGDLTQVPYASLVRALGKASARHLHDLARALDPRPVVPQRPAKSVGHEETFIRDLRTRDEVEREIVRLSDAVSRRLYSTGLVARSVAVKFRYASFVTLTRSCTSDHFLLSAPSIAEVARRLSSEIDVAKGVRLLGVSVSRLASSGTDARQLSLDVEPVGGLGADRTAGNSSEDAGRRSGRRSSDSGELWNAVAAVRGRFGDASIGPASLYTPGGLRLKRRGDTQWGPPA